MGMRLGYVAIPILHTLDTQSALLFVDMCIQQEGGSALDFSASIYFSSYRIGPRCRVWAKILHHRSSPKD